MNLGPTSSALSPTIPGLLKSRTALLSLNRDSGTGCQVLLNISAQRDQRIQGVS